MSTFGPVSALTFVNTDADFRAWATVVHNALASGGLVQTGDSGQIVLASVVKPGVANTAGGYEVWRFADTLQATVPLFFKIEYGVGTAITTPSLWITVGSGSNAAGTLTGLTSTRTQMSPAASTLGTTKSVYASVATNRVWVAGGIDWATATNSFFFGIERTKDSTGADTADGFYVQTSGGATTGTSFQSALWAGGASAASASSGPIVAPVSSRTAVATDVAVTPSLYYQGKPFYPTMLGAQAADIPGNLTYALTYLGGSHTYISLANAVATGFSQGGASTFYPQVLWE